MENIFFDRSKLKYCGENVIIGKAVRIRKPEDCIILDNTIIEFKPFLALYKLVPSSAIPK